MDGNNNNNPRFYYNSNESDSRQAWLYNADISYSQMEDLISNGIYNLYIIAAAAFKQLQRNYFRNYGNIYNGRRDKRIVVFRTDLCHDALAYPSYIFDADALYLCQ